VDCEPGSAAAERLASRETGVALRLSAAPAGSASGDGAGAEAVVAAGAGTAGAEVSGPSAISFSPCARSSSGVVIASPATAAVIADLRSPRCARGVRRR
jgi:hypothetical protein